MPVPAIPVQPHRHLKVETVVYRVRLRPADVVLIAAGTKHRPGETQGDRFVGPDWADVLEARQEDFVEGQNAVALLDVVPQQRHQLVHQLSEIVGNVLLEAADAKIVVHQAGA